MKKLGWGLALLLTACEADHSQSESSAVETKGETLVKCTGKVEIENRGTDPYQLAEPKSSTMLNTWWLVSVNDIDKTIKIQADTENEKFSDVCLNTSSCSVIVTRSAISVIYQSSYKAGKITNLQTNSGEIDRIRGVGSSKYTTTYLENGVEIGRRITVGTYDHCAKAEVSDLKPKF